MVNMVVQMQSKRKHIGHKKLIIFCVLPKSNYVRTIALVPMPAYGGAWAKVLGFSQSEGEKMIFIICTVNF